MDKRDVVIEAARLVIAETDLAQAAGEPGVNVVFNARLLALRFAVRALDGGAGRRLRDFGDECDGRCCPDHRYSEG